MKAYGTATLDFSVISDLEKGLELLSIDVTVGIFAAATSTMAEESFTVIVGVSNKLAEVGRVNPVDMVNTTVVPDGMTTSPTLMAKRAVSTPVL